MTVSSKVFLSPTSEAMKALQNMQSAYESFSSCPQEEFRNRRNNFFLTINKMHTLLFSDSESYFHRDVYLHEAEKILGDARHELREPAKQYVGTFKKFNETLGNNDYTFRDVQRNIRELKKAHFAFSEKFSKEIFGWKSLLSYVAIGL